MAQKIEVKVKKVIPGNPVILNLAVYNTSRECSCFASRDTKPLKTICSHFNCEVLDELNSTINLKDDINHAFVRLKGYQLLEFIPVIES